MSLSWIGGGSIVISTFFGIGRTYALSLSIVVVTKKKINNKKAMSAIEPALISGMSRLAIVST
jgi:hypothetical protein